MTGLFYNLLISLVLFGAGFARAADYGHSLSNYQQKLRLAGEDMLENLEVSYVYGGSQIGDGKTCEDCNRCLEDNRPAPKERFKVCKACLGCSLDCSHFVQLVFARAGLTFPYLTSAQMLDLSQEALEKKYSLRPVGAAAIREIIPGDLLVYRGHVVIVEKVHGPDSGDIIHATGGKDIKEPGQGIQRERFARMSTFRGELLRVVRHAKLDALWHESKLGDQSIRASSSDASRSRGRFKMRPVEKRRAD
jgi:hypothetical protein